jgi:hypothetical protein
MTLATMNWTAVVLAGGMLFILYLAHRRKTKRLQKDAENRSPDKEQILAALGRGDHLTCVLDSPDRMEIDAVETLLSLKGIPFVTSDEDFFTQMPVDLPRDRPAFAVFVLRSQKAQAVELVRQARDKKDMQGS